MDSHEGHEGHNHEWSAGFWSCCSPCGTCFKAACCPCFLYGKVSSRLDDPALKEYSHMNGSCCLYALTSYVGFYWVLLMLKRGQMRDRFGIEGNGCKDCMAACCCPCCVLMQQDKETEAQSEKIEKASGAAGYQSPAGMAYGQF